MKKKIIGSRVFPVINKHLMFLFQLYAHCWKKEEQWLLRNKAVWYIVDPAGKKSLLVVTTLMRKWIQTIRRLSYEFHLTSSDRSWFTAIWFRAVGARKKSLSHTFLDLSLGESHAFSDSLPMWPFHFCSAPTASTQQRSLSHPPPPTTKPHSINHTSAYLKILPCLFS